MSFRLRALIDGNESMVNSCPSSVWLWVDSLWGVASFSSDFIFPVSDGLISPCCCTTQVGLTLSAPLIRLGHTICYRPFHRLESDWWKKTFLWNIFHWNLEPKHHLVARESVLQRIASPWEVTLRSAACHISGTCRMTRGCLLFNALRAGKSSFLSSASHHVHQ